MGLRVGALPQGQPATYTCFPPALSTAPGQPVPLHRQGPTGGPAAKPGSMAARDRPLPRPPPPPEKDVLGTQQGRTQEQREIQPRHSVVRLTQMKRDHARSMFPGTPSHGTPARGTLLPPRSPSRATELAPGLPHGRRAVLGQQPGGKPTPQSPAGRQRVRVIRSPEAPSQQSPPGPLPPASPSP